MDLFRSTVSGVLWPAIAETRSAQLLSLLWQFDQVEHWPAERLLQHQLQQLALVIDHAQRTVPFYRERFAALGHRGGGSLTLTELRQLPRLTRRHVQDAGLALRSTAIPPQFGACHENRSSGATGQPVLVLRTALDALIWQANTLRDHHWHRRNQSLKFAAIRALAQGVAEPPLGQTAVGWGAASEAVRNTGSSALLSLSADVATQAAWLKQHAPGYLLTYPSNLRALLAHFAAAGERLPGLHAVLTVAETVAPALRAACNDVLGVNIEDVYSTQEMGYIALQCPVSGLYHVMAESVLVEVLDAAGNACAPGETGRLVISSLHNYATPLIRYEVGDYATVGGPCACGRTLPTLERIAGRERNMVRLPDGGLRWPVMGMTPYTEVAPVRQFQMIQHSLEMVEVRLATERDLTREEEARLGAIMRAELGHPFELHFTYYRHELPSNSNGKFEEFVCAIE